MQERSGMQPPISAGVATTYGNAGRRSRASTLLPRAATQFHDQRRRIAHPPWLG